MKYVFSYHELKAIMELFKKVVFIFFTACSILCYLFALLLYFIHVTDGPSMAMLFFLPSLVGGFIGGAFAWLVKIIAKPKLSKTLIGIHRLHIVLILIGSMTIIYVLYFL